MALEREVISDRDTIGHLAEIDFNYLPYMIAYKSALTELLKLDAAELSTSSASNNKSRLNNTVVTNEINAAIEWINHAYLLIKNNQAK